ncbi:TetR family transcriptional regulator [Stackebrandtia endophytica]|uniref:TetR family transcriptional regulator n=1 Tax=Stackebrandtia endophytica TaxID=1496996 RepID=A0A543AQ50_9ACTN|nr:TetR/AcrR family transcriptional regulator [Stackebrandtia endophytica]TQL74655.1 TetR family transcriptional regulator [Stackebrandtia endophytica]
MPRVVDHAARRRAISEAVQRLVGQEGLDGLTMARAASAAGVSVGQLQHYFDSKDALLEDMFARQVHRMRRRAGELAEASVGARSSIRSVVVEALTDRLPATPEQLGEQRVWMAFLSRASVRPDLSVQYETAFDHQLNLLGQAVHNGKECGEVPTDTDSTSAAWRLLALTDGLAAQQSSRPNPDSVSAARLVTEAVSEVFPGRCRQWG